MLRLLRLNHPRHRGGGIPKNNAANAVDPREIDDRMQNGHIAGTNKRCHIPRRESADQELGPTNRELLHRGSGDGTASTTAQAKDASQFPFRL